MTFHNERAPAAGNSRGARNGGERFHAQHASAEPLLQHSDDAMRLLECIAPGERVTFQTFDDDPKRKEPRLQGHRTATLAEDRARLAALNVNGAGIFWMVNAGDGKGRKTDNVQRVRALFVDLDGAPLEPVQSAPLPPHAIVESSPGRWHAYWRIVDCPLGNFRTLQKALAARFNGDATVCDLPRVLRLPGFLHQKPAADFHSGQPFRSRLLECHPDRAPYTLAEFRAAFGFAEAPPSQPRAAGEARTLQATDGTPYGRAALRAACNAIANAPEGQRNVTLNREAFGIAGLVAGGELPESAHADMEAAVDRAGLAPPEVAATLASGWDAGSKQPRNAPPVARQYADALDAPSAPEPLRRPTPPPQPYPIAELGPILRPACEAIRREIQAPDAICGASLLAAASLAAQGLADVRIDGRTYPLSLWMLTVAESGERKSAVDDEAMRAASEYERECHDAYASAREAYENEAEQYNAQREAAKGQAKKTNGEGLAAKLAKLRAPEPPLLPKLTIADFTAEGIAKLLRDGRPSIGAFTDEAGLVFGGHGMTKETETRTAATLCKLWDRGELDRVRSGEGALKLYGKRLALHLLAQPIIAERALGNAVLSGQGFLPRCLLAWPEGTAGTRGYVGENLKDNPALLQFNARTGDLLRRELPLRDGTRNALQPRVLTLTPDAKAAWIEAYNAVEASEAPGQRFEQCKAWASKSAEQALRIAGVLRLVEEPDAQTIDVDTVRRAFEIALWHLNEAARLAGTAELSPEVRDAEALLNWCHDTGRTWLHSRAALRYGPNRIRERSRFMAAAKVLESAGWAQPVEGGMELDGAHRRNVWRIAPKEPQP